MGDSIHIKDKRMFNPDGSLREDVKEESQAEQAPKENQQSHHAKEEAEQKTTPNLPPHSGEIDFPTFILSLASSVQISLGLVANPITGKTEKDLNHAKQTIDIIGMLEKKTEGNLTPEESGLLKQILYQLRMGFVEVQKKEK